MTEAEKRREEEEQLRSLLLSSTGRQRFTQDSPIYADVWLGYLGAAPDERQDLLLEPHHRVPSRDLAKVLSDRLPVGIEHELAYAGEYVAARLTLRELLTVALPLSPWWTALVRPAPKPGVFAHLDAFARGAALAPDAGEETKQVPPPTEDLRWLVNVAGHLLVGRTVPEGTENEADALRALTADVLEALGRPKDHEPLEHPPLWSVSRNRRVQATLWRSRLTVKADAACRVFPVDTEGIAWAVVDSGIDARHPAFRLRDEDGGLKKLDASGDFDDVTIVRATYDFTRLRTQIATAMLAGSEQGPAGEEAATGVSDALVYGQAVDWRRFKGLVEVKHDGGYERELDPHGTHVAGILAGDWRPTDGDQPPRHPLQGVCPGLALYDLRVLDKDGVGDEFGVLAALSFIRWRNAESGGTVIHGVNLSFALEHDVLNSACGRSPVCLEAERVHNAGVVVVAAAGNDGRADYSLGGRSQEGYRTVSIADPGNAESVITVGSTHRLEPHAYGVSFFSSRGPTGDGRSKPDIVAPGEKITAPVPGNQFARMDGTSMAAPHVAGAAALLMARHRELVGRPGVVKQVLCDTATDLGRERHYQGRGMVDILRAVQSV